MNRQALFCDGTEQYVFPPEVVEDQKIRFRFRTAKGDVQEIKLVTQNACFSMHIKERTEIFDYYETECVIGSEPLRYYFEIHGKDGDVCYYNRYSVVDEPLDEYAFVLVPGFSTPEWAKGAVMYQIFVDRFCNGDSSNDVQTGEYSYIGGLSKKIEDWYQKPAKTMAIREFYGGDLQGVLDKLDYLQDLGVEVIYFNPLFVSPSNHKYDIQDYDYIDPHFGKIVKDGGELLPEGCTNNELATKYQMRTAAQENLEASNEFFAYVVSEIHKRGMKVILDGVFNHCGSFNKWMDREKIYQKIGGYEPGAYPDSDSPYKEFFRFYDENAWPDNGSYDGWWGHDNHPKLNYDSTKLENYILGIAKKWVSPPYNVDGWRLDVAADLGWSKEDNHLFWEKFRKVVKTANPNALILAEHYGDPQEWLQGNEWDTVMNYDAFMEPVTWFLTGMEKHSDSSRPDLCDNADYFINSIKHHMTKMMPSSLQTAMNELSNHDHSRFLTRTNHITGRVDQKGYEAAEIYTNPAVMREAVVMQMTWVGAPTIYYGDEAGVCGFTDPDNRRTYPWGQEDQEMIAFHKDIIAIHKRYYAFRTGSLKMLMWQEGILAYARFNDTRQFVIIVNNRSERATVHVPVWQAGISMRGMMRRLLYTYDQGYTTEYEEYIIEDGEIVLNMGRHSAIILKKREY
nr:glycoside hydrolase family 13 protein [uncultured Sellimonas sp.]